ncbi:ATP-grasp domain-containing protein [Flammeovirga aprica]|uniref:ATP-grasp domain-containing protein n=1 Tax=Flammeovirga aprica JL-4 TaxID=694437 RepID=A0A7X9RTS9_9BACT|nr:ATP-grasp domain-containing protein [Flammeovirga aprica]NME67682.1 ATP-grasp domain-containing protein [Flammeovirga aprica JL-4]
MTLANPGMKYGGFFNYSKFNALKQIPEEYLPKSHFFQTTPTLQEVKSTMKQLDLSFPIILKPDEGERGSGVEKIKSDAEIEKYLSDNPSGVILQEFITANFEYGVMYVRHPSQQSGQITSVVYKGELFVVGDGKSTLIELFRNHNRAILYIDFLKEKYSEELERVLPDNKVFMLSKMGNHCRGAIFNDANYLKDELDIRVFDKISSHVDDFYFGRYDLKAESEEALKKGHFKIMELNGVNSEPAHIYDPDNSILRAYKDLFSHWWKIYQISKENRKKGYQETSFPILVKSLMQR